MPASLLILLPLLAQLGPTVAPGGGPALPTAPLPERRAAAAPALPPRTQLQECTALIASDPAAAAEVAEAWRDSAKGSARAEPGQCLGGALTRLERWDEAEAAFLAARDDTPANEGANKARAGAMAGAAALAAGKNDRALIALDRAHGDAIGAAETQLAGDIAVDRARALVRLKRDADALHALDEARRASPGNADAWLLSATLARRQNRLADAQAQIEQAAVLAPIDPEVGLEAGVIAVLAGRDEAARKSWESVIAAAPASPAAQTARGYLAQLGPAPAPPAGR